MDLRKILKDMAPIVETALIQGTIVLLDCLATALKEQIKAKRQDSVLEKIKELQDSEKE